jgi:hypothetical protein
MVNIKFYLEGKKILQNEYQNTSVVCFEDVIIGNNMDKKAVYEIIITRTYKKHSHSVEKTMYLVPLLSEKWGIYEVEGKNKLRRKHPNYCYSPLSSRDSSWKIFFNLKPCMKFVNVQTNIVNTNFLPDYFSPDAVYLLGSQEQLETIYETCYNFEFLEEGKKILNGKEVDNVKYENLLTYNVIIRNITIIKTAQQYSYSCIIS